MNMMQEFFKAVSTGAIVTHLGYASYLLVFLLVLLEGPVATLAAAALAGAGRLNPWAVFITAGAGNLTADGLWYLIGYAGHMDTVRKHLPGFKRFDPQIRAVKKRLQKDGVKLLVLSKITFGIVAIPILIGAGMAKVPWRRLLAAAAACQVVLGGAMVLAGYYLGGAVVRERLGLQAAMVIAGLLLFFVFMTIYRYVVPPSADDRDRNPGEDISQP